MKKNRIMKWLLSAGLVFTMLAFAGCGNTDEAVNSGGQQEGSAAADRADGSGSSETGSQGTGQKEQEGGKLQIVTTIFPPYDFARAVAGDLADITMLIKPGAETHSFDPSPADIIQIQDADVFIYIGGENDAWVEEILKSMDTGDKTILCLMDYVDAVEEEIVEGMEDDHGHDDDDHDDNDDPDDRADGDDHDDDDRAVHGEEGDDHDDDGDDHGHDDERELDEHIWTSPSNAIQLIEVISQTVQELDPVNADTYEANKKAYQDQIAEVRDQIKEIVDEAQYQVMVFGDRFPFRYFADEFNLDYRAAFPGCSTETEVSAGTMAYLIDFVKELGLSYIYHIELSSENVARTICEETGAELLLLHSVHNITKDDFEAGETYVSLMKANAENLRKGLN